MPLPTEMIRFTAVSDPEAIGDTRVRRFKISSSAVARDGHTLATSGWKLDNFRKNPVVLAAHDSGHIESVIGRAANLPANGDDLFADIEFMPAEINPLAEMTMRMVDAGFLRATSVGFIPLDGKPAKGRGAGAYDFSSQELLEISIVPVGSLPDALLAARSAGIDTTPAIGWAKRILENHEMPTSVAKTTFKRDLSDCGWLAQLLQSLACLQSYAEWEAEYEEDNSPIPGLLFDAIKTLGGILIAMTAEEVAELIGDEVGGDRATDTAGQRIVKALGRRANKISMPIAVDTASLAAEMRAMIAEIAKTRAGRVLSADNEACVRAVHGHLTEAISGIGGLISQVDDGTPEEDDNGDGSPGADDDTAERALRSRKAKALSHLKP